MDPLVKNAADPSQVKNAERQEQFKKDDDRNDMLWVLSTPQGRRVIWKLLTFCRVFESIWSQSAAIHYNAGQQDVGHRVLTDIDNARPEALLEMMYENKPKEKANGKSQR